MHCCRNARLSVCDCHRRRRRRRREQLGDGVGEAEGAAAVCVEQRQERLDLRQEEGLLHVATPHLAAGRQVRLQGQQHRQSRGGPRPPPTHRGGAGGPGPTEHQLLFHF